MENGKVELLHKPTLELLMGGKTIPPGYDWLSTLPIGTIYLAQFDIGWPSAILEKRQVTNKSEKAVEIWDIETDKYEWVVPYLYCKDQQLYEILNVVPEKEKEYP